MAELSKFQSRLFFLLMSLVVAASGHSIEQASSQVYEMDSAHSRCNQVAKSASVTSSIVCAMMCSREPACVGYNLEVACNACAKTCQITSSLGSCVPDGDFNSFARQTSKEAGTTEVATTKQSPTTPTTTSLSTSTTTTPILTTTTTTTTPLLTTTTPTTTTTPIPTTTTTTPITTTITTTPLLTSTTALTTQAVTTTTTTARNNAELFFCDAELSGKVVVGIRTSFDGNSIAYLYMKNADVSGTLQTAIIPHSCTAGFVVVDVDCGDGGEYTCQLWGGRLGSMVTTYAVKSVSMGSSVKEYICPSDTVLFAITTQLLNGAFYAFAASCIEVLEW